MVEFLRGMWLIVTLDLRQRVRGVAWYVLLGVFFVIVGLVTAILWVSTNAWDAGGGGIFSTIVFFVLLLVTLVSPALSGNAINGERDAGTLATTQVTLVTTGQLLVGKFLAAWITGLAFLAAALPFLIVAVALGEVSLLTIAVSTLVLTVELGVIAAIGVGLSGILNRPLFSVVVTYLVIAILSIGTPIAFVLGGTATRSTVTVTNVPIDWSATDNDAGPNDDVVCGEPTTYTYEIPRFDYYWGILAANPYVVLADAVPPMWDTVGSPTDAFGWLSTAVRASQQAPELESFYDECASWNPAEGDDEPYPTQREIYDSTVPSWFVGLTIHIVLGAALMFFAYRRTDTPAGTLPKGARIA